jgi:FkbM family methyltransferase
MIRLRTAGRHKPARPLRWLADGLSWIAQRATVEVVLPAPDGQLRFRCPNALTLRRAYTLYVKEAGTIDWLDQALRPGDEFLDIGANIGVYTLYAAQRVGSSGHVYAVEPHLPNAVALMENVVANALGERVSLLTCALAEAPRPARFDYGEWRTGSSRSQLAGSGDHPGAPTQSASKLSELKLAQTVDALIAEGAIRSPQVVKIDVDGTELSILLGMRGMLTAQNRPRTLQVECMPDNAREIETLLAGCGYTLRQRHATMAGAKRLATGAEVAGIVHNAVFSAA